MRPLASQNTSPNPAFSNRAQNRNTYCPLLALIGAVKYGSFPVIVTFSTPLTASSLQLLTAFNPAVPLSNFQVRTTSPLLPFSPVPPSTRNEMSATFSPASREYT